MKLAVLLVVTCIFLCSRAFAGEWKLVWSDEFDRDGPPDATRWGYEAGFVRNSEKQYYTPARAENARVKDGLLIVEGRKERFRNAAHKPGSKDWRKKDAFADYTSACLVTLGKASWKYGRVEVRAKLPSGKGVWPAIWMMGANRGGGARWPGCGEIDIMEFVGKDPNRVHANAHFARDGKHASKGGKLRTPAPCDDFHVYAMDWYEDRIEFYFDRNNYHTFKIDEAGKGPENPFRKPFYLLINLALGGSWGGDLDDGALPAKFLIDYVRVYAPKGPEQ